MVKIRSLRHVPLFHLAVAIILSSGLVITLLLTKSPQRVSIPVFAAACDQGVWHCLGEKAERCHNGEWIFQFGCAPLHTCVMDGNLPHCTPISK